MEECFEQKGVQQKEPQRRQSAPPQVKTRRLHSTAPKNRAEKGSSTLSRPGPTPLPLFSQKLARIQVPGSGLSK